MPTDAWAEVEVMKAFQRGSATILILAAMTLIAISVWTFFSNFGQGKPNEPSAIIQASNGNIGALTQTQKDEIRAQGQHVTFTLQAQGLHLAARTLDATLTFQMPPEVQRQLYDVTTGARIYTCTAGGKCHLKTPYRDLKLNLELLTASSEPGTDRDFKWAVPLRFIEKSLLNHAVRTVTIPLAGFPALYPQDYYFGDQELSWSIPNVAHLVNGKAPTGESRDVYAFEPGNVGEPMKVGIAPLLNGSQKAVPGALHVSFERKTQEQLYTYAVALIPLIFAFLFLHLLFFSQHFHHKVFEEFTEALIVAILAVLPLRVVLVPVELEGLTRVDLVLGLGLVLIVAVAVCKYASEIWGAAEHPESVNFGGTETDNRPTRGD